MNDDEVGSKLGMWIFGAVFIKMFLNLFLSQAVQFFLLIGLAIIFVFFST